LKTPNEPKFLSLHGNTKERRGKAKKKEGSPKLKVKPPTKIFWANSFLNNQIWVGKKEELH